MDRHGVRLVTPAEVLVRHLSDNDTGQEDCIDCSLPWPCDAVQMARQLQEAQARVARLADILGRVQATVRALQFLPETREITAREDAYNKGVQDLADAIARTLAQPVGEP